MLKCILLNKKVNGNKLNIMKKINYFHGTFLKYVKKLLKFKGNKLFLLNILFKVASVREGNPDARVYSRT